MADLVAIVELEVTGGTREEVAELLYWHAGESRKENGCLHFDVVIDRDDSKKIHLYEVWTNQAALDAHVQSPHRKRVGEELKDKYRQVGVTWCERQ
jgi:autoinducer 2-degrading protein